MNARFTYRELITDAAARLENGSDSPRLDAELLLARALDRPRSHIGAWPERRPDVVQLAEFERLLERRLQGEPMAHILGEREFWSLDLQVTPDTLIPRPDTEMLVETALEKIPPGRGCRVLDLGTGTGAIALAIKKERPLAEVAATDASEPALEVARRNAQRHRLQVEFRAGDWWLPFADRQFDVVVSNPPYIADSDSHLASGDVRFEPRSALASGPAGLDDLERIIGGVPALLAPGGWLLVEHGYDQAEPVAERFAQAGFVDIRCHRDLGGQLRVTQGRRPAGTRSAARKP